MAPSKSQGKLKTTKQGEKKQYGQDRSGQPTQY